MHVWSFVQSQWWQYHMSKEQWYFVQRAGSSSHMRTWKVRNPIPETVNQQCRDSCSSNGCVKAQQLVSGQTLRMMYVMFWYETSKKLMWAKCANPLQSSYKIPCSTRVCKWRSHSKASPMSRKRPVCVALPCVHTRVSMTSKDRTPHIVIGLRCRLWRRSLMFQCWSSGKCLPTWCQHVMTAGSGANSRCLALRFLLLISQRPFILSVLCKPRQQIEWSKYLSSV